MKHAQEGRSIVFHHSYPENTFLPWSEGETDILSRARYFPSIVLKHLGLDHLPYFISFGSGCTGLLSMLILAGGMWNKKSSNPIICLTADVRPPETTFDAMREKILTSDCSSGFVVSRERRGYRLLGISYYSTPRQIVPLVEIVKRTVKMIRELAKELTVDLSPGQVVVHYPNIFTSAWEMVSQYLNVPKELHVLDDLAERAHCLSSDSMISLAKWHGGGAGRTHVVVNFGSGLHLGACILREEAAC
jgi:3-oxoacyl-[acyl-carrier-protein] synthase III